MLSKLGFILLFLAFGLFMALTGAWLPADLRGPLNDLKNLILPLAAAPSPAPGATPAAKAAAAPGPGKTASTAASASAAPVKGGEAEEPIPLESLSTPSPTPANARYALRLGLFPAQEDAQALCAKVDGLHLPGLTARCLPVLDRQGELWWLATAGDQAAPGDLETPRAWLRERLGLRVGQVILAPPPKPAKKTAP